MSSEKVNLYPCCDDPNCPYCYGSGIYEPEEGDNWLERLELALQEIDAKTLVESKVATPTPITISVSPTNGNRTCRVCNAHIECEPYDVFPDLCEDCIPLELPDEDMPVVD